MTVATTPAGFPIEKSTTIGTRYANAGSTCITSSTGRSVLLTGVHTAAAMPSGIPMTIEIRIATAISASVVMAGSHMTEIPFGPPFGICRMPNDATMTAAKTAVRQRPTSQATSVASVRTPSHVSQWRPLTTSFVALLRPFPMPPMMVWRKKFDDWFVVTQALRRSNQFGTPLPSTQFAGKPLWKPLNAIPTTQIATPAARGTSQRPKRPTSRRRGSRASEEATEEAAGAGLTECPACSARAPAPPERSAARGRRGCG